MAILNWITETLEKGGVEYASLRHDRVFTAQGLAEREHVSGRRVAKVVAVIADGRPALAVLPAPRHLDLEKFAAVTDASNAHLASEVEMARFFPDCEVGAEPPLRHWPAVALWADSSLVMEGDIVFAAGTHEEGVRMRVSDWLRIAAPDLADIAVE